MPTPLVTAWPHSPPHLFEPEAMYMVTGATYEKRLYFQGDERLSLLQDTLLTAADAYGWALQAWAVFPNHYHLIAQAPTDAASLQRMIQRLHSQTARLINGLDRTPGRQVWFQYWDTCLTFETSYYARLHYVHENAVKHGIVTDPTQYAYCSAAWFVAHAPKALQTRVYSAPFERVVVLDDF